MRGRLLKTVSPWPIASVPRRRQPLSNMLNNVVYGGAARSVMLRARQTRNTTKKGGFGSALVRQLPQAGLIGLHREALWGLRFGYNELPEKRVSPLVRRLCIASGIDANGLSTTMYALLVTYR